LESAVPVHVFHEQIESGGNGNKCKTQHTNADDQKVKSPNFFESCHGGTQSNWAIKIFGLSDVLAKNSFLFVASALGFALDSKRDCESHGRKSKHPKHPAPITSLVAGDEDNSASDDWPYNLTDRSAQSLRGEHAGTDPDRILIGDQRRGDWDIG
jgi:hypothetical protein